MSVNKVILIGNVGKDPDVRYLENNVCVANFTLATTERGYTTQSGIQIPDKTEWHNIVAVSYTHLRAHETGRNLVCRLLLEKKKTKK